MRDQNTVEEYIEIKKSAYKEYRKALHQKQLVPAKSCENCLEEGLTHGHHKDHRNPLEVVWLCRTCHNQVHTCNKFSNGHIPAGSFKDRTSKGLNQKEKELLYKKLGLDQFRNIPLEERCTQEEKEMLLEYDRLSAKYIRQSNKAYAIARHYHNQAEDIRRQLNEKYPKDIQQIY